MWYSQPDDLNKNAIVERFNRTLANKIQLWRTATKRYDWNKVLPDLVKNYNNTVHSTLKCTPTQIWEGKAESKQKLEFVEQTLKIDDHVRIKISKLIFSKGDQQEFSKSVYKINEIDGNKIFVEGQDRYYKPYELMKTNLLAIHRKEDELVEIEEKVLPEENIPDLPYDYDEIVQDRKARRVTKKLNKELEINMNNIAPIDEKRIRKPNSKYNF
jgi:hypothetical protein